MRRSRLLLSFAIFSLLTPFTAAGPVAEVVNTINTGLTTVDVAVGGPGVFVLGRLASGQGQLNLYSHTIPPVLLDTVLTGFDPLSLATGGNRAYVANQEDLRFVDASNPANLVVRSTLPGGSRDIDAAGSWLYAVGGVDGHAGVRIIDASSVDVPVQRAHYLSNFGGGHSVEVDGQLLFLGMTGELGGAVDIISLAQPLSPVRVGQIFVDSDPQAFERLGSTLYIASRATSFVQQPSITHIYDIANPAAPRLIDNFTPGGFDVAVARGLAIVAEGKSLHVADVSDPTFVPNTLTSVNTPSRDIALGSGYARVVGGANLTTYAYTADPLPDGVLTLTQEDLGGTTEGELFFHSHIDEQDDLINNIWFTGRTGTALANFLVGSPNAPEPDNALIPTDQPELQLKAELLTAHFNTLMDEPALESGWFLNAWPITDTDNGTPLIVTPPQHSALERLAAVGTTVGHVIQIGANILFQRAEDPNSFVTVNGVGITQAELTQVLHLINDSFAGGEPTGVVATVARPRPALSVPILVSPGSSTAPGPVFTTGVELVWDPNAAADEYFVEIYNDETGRRVGSGRTHTNRFTPPGRFFILNTEGRFRWTVSAINESGQTAFAPPLYFQLDIPQ